jgi:phosphomevalonate kinase
MQLKSRQLSISLTLLAEIPPFNPMGVELADITKTGLGSLVALIMSLVTALLVQSGLIAPNQLASASAQHLAHNVAQFVHCLAQGKGGSGFDVSAAYSGASSTCASIQPCCSRLWMTRCVPVPLPPL